MEDLCFFAAVATVEDDIDQDADDQTGSNGTDLDIAEVERQTADAAYQDGGNNEQVAVVVQVNRLDHFKAAYRDEAVERDADAADDAGGDRIYKADEGIEEAEQDAVDCSEGDGAYGSVAGDGDAADGLAVGGVGAAADEGTNNGTDTVADQGVIQTGIGDQVTPDDGRQVLMVGNVLGKGYKGNGREEDKQTQYIGKALDGVGSIVIYTEHAQEGETGHLEKLHVVKGGKIDQLERFAIGELADIGQSQRDHISTQDADNEGDHLHTLAALYGGIHGDEEGDQTDKNGHQIVAAGSGVIQVVNSTAAQGKTDQGNGGADYDGGQELADPGCTGLFDDQSDENINQTCEQGTDEDAEEAKGGCTGQRADKGEGTSQEHRALLTGGDVDVEQRAETGSAQGSGLVQIQSGAVGQHGHQQSSGHDGQQLLEGVDKVLLEGRLLIDVIDQFHRDSLRFCDQPCAPFALKNLTPGRVRRSNTIPSGVAAFPASLDRG